MSELVMTAIPKFAIATALLASALQGFLKHIFVTKRYELDATNVGGRYEN